MNNWFTPHNQNIIFFIANELLSYYLQHHITNKHVE